MIGKLTVDYFENGKLQREAQEGLTALEASMAMVVFMAKFPNVQFTWAAKEESNG